MRTLDIYSSDGKAYARTTAPGGSRGRMRQAQGLSIDDPQGLDLGIDRVDRELKIERGRDGPDFS